MPAKPRGYWDDFANLEQELLAFVAERGTAGVMPTHAMLQSAGRGDLSTAMHRHGGVLAVAERLGLTRGDLANAIARAGGQYATAQRLGLRPTDTRRAPNHWADVAQLERELRAFVAEPGRPQRMPKLAELIAAGRFDLHYALQRHGGVRALAERLGWPIASQRQGPAPEPGSGAVDASGLTTNAG